MKGYALYQHIIEQSIEAQNDDIKKLRDQQVNSQEEPEAEKDRTGSPPTVQQRSQVNGREEVGA